jgi:hypothetical protein
MSKKVVTKDTKKVVSKGAKKAKPSKPVKASKAVKNSNPKKVSKGKEGKGTPSKKTSKKTKPVVAKEDRVQVLTGTPLEDTLREPTPGLEDPIWKGQNFKLRGVEWAYSPLGKKWICFTEVGPYITLSVLPKSCKTKKPFEIEASMYVFDKNIEVKAQGASPNEAITSALCSMGFLVTKYVSLKIKNLAKSQSWKALKSLKG